ncbi:MAG: hypothetical protein NC092_10715, partial [Butyrivibrio sp.]|nr:hypothetical protein [Muribaculum sp.]MCM1553152.1 hypothetical protein [Butyrivibrio sp.]
VVTLGEKPRHVPDVTYGLSVACFVKKCKRNFMKIKVNQSNPWCNTKFFCHNGLRYFWIFQYHIPNILLRLFYIFW